MKTIILIIVLLFSFQSSGQDVTDFEASSLFYDYIKERYQSKMRISEIQRESEKFMPPKILDSMKQVIGNGFEMNLLGGHAYKVASIEGNKMTLYTAPNSYAIWGSKTTYEVVRIDGELYLDPSFTKGYLNPWKTRENIKDQKISRFEE